MAKRVCAEIGCPVLTDRTRCPEHARAKDRARGTSTDRGYGAEHRKLRAALAPAAVGTVCHFCGQPIEAGQKVALDHTEDRTGYRGIVHLVCNAADGGRRTPRGT